MTIIPPPGKVDQTASRIYDRFKGYRVYVHHPTPPYGEKITVQYHRLDTMIPEGSLVIAKAEFDGIETLMQELFFLWNEPDPRRLADG